MSWTDEELDKLFSDSAGDMTFEYKKEYFKDIEKHLPISRKRDFLWNGFSLLMGSVIVYLMIQPTVPVEVSVAKSSVVHLAGTEASGYSSEVAGIRTDSFEGTEISVQSDPQAIELIKPESRITSEPAKDNFKLTGQSIQEDVEIVSATTELHGQKVSLLAQNEFDKELLDKHDAIDGIDRTPRLDFFVQGVGGIGQGKMLPGEKVSKLTGLGLGVEYNRNRLSASFAMNGMVSHHEGMELSRISKVYGFGSTEYKSTIEYSKLFSVESELTLGYRMGRLSAFGGLNVSYLVSTECSITNSVDNIEADNDVRKVYGYTTGLKSWGLKPMIGLSYDFLNNVQLGANLGAQVLETVESEYLEGVSRPMPLEGRIYVRWKF